MKTEYCTDCGAELNEGEAKTFSVCDACWDKHYREINGEIIKDNPMKPNQTEGSTGVEHEAENLLVEMSVTMNNLCRFYDQKDDRAMKFTMDKAYELSHKGIAHLMELDKANEKIAACLAALKELIEPAQWGYNLLVKFDKDRMGKTWPEKIENAKRITNGQQDKD